MLKLYRAVYTDENGTSKESVAMPKKMLAVMFDQIQDTIDVGTWSEVFVADVSYEEWESIEQSYKQA
jgi:hypothetical protein